MFKIFLIMIGVSLIGLPCARAADAWLQENDALLFIANVQQQVHDRRFEAVDEALQKLPVEIEKAQNNIKNVAVRDKLVAQFKAEQTAITALKTTLTNKAGTLQLYDSIDQDMNKSFSGNLGALVVAIAQLDAVMAGDQKKAVLLTNIVSQRMNASSRLKDDNPDRVIEDIVAAAKLGDSDLWNYIQTLNSPKLPINFRGTGENKISQIETNQGSGLNAIIQKVTGALANQAAAQTQLDQANSDLAALLQFKGGEVAGEIADTRALIARLVTLIAAYNTRIHFALKATAGYLGTAAASQFLNWEPNFIDTALDHQNQAPVVIEDDKTQMPFSKALPSRFAVVQIYQDHYHKSQNILKQQSLDAFKADANNLISDLVSLDDYHTSQAKVSEMLAAYQKHFKDAAPKLEAQKK